MCVFVGPCDYVWENRFGGHMDCDFHRAQPEVSMELSSSALIWQVLMAEAGNKQQLRTPTSVEQVQASPAAKWTVAMS